VIQILSFMMGRVSLASVISHATISWNEINYKCPTILKSSKHGSHSKLPAPEWLRSVDKRSRPVRIQCSAKLCSCLRSMITHMTLLPPHISRPCLTDCLTHHTRLPSVSRSNKTTDIWAASWTKIPHEPPKNQLKSSCDFKVGRAVSLCCVGCRSAVSPLLGASGQHRPLRQCSSSSQLYGRRFTMAAPLAPRGFVLLRI